MYTTFFITILVCLVSVNYIWTQHHECWAIMLGLACFMDAVVYLIKDTALEKKVFEND